MIVDLQGFLRDARPQWRRLHALLDTLGRDPDRRLSLEEAKTLHYLYEKACADLAKLTFLSAQSEVRQYLESLVARAYGEIHETRRSSRRLHPLNWFVRTFPRTFRRRIKAFLLAAVLTVGGAFFGGAATVLDADAKHVLMPFPHLQQHPADRVAREEGAGAQDRLAGAKSWFSARLMTHNTRISFLAMALGMTFGIGTGILLFYNGVILGAVVADYVFAGQAVFLTGWLLPHGSIEIPAVLIAGQAGFVLAGALIGWGAPVSMRHRLRTIAPDVLTLIGGVAILLVWAGVIEAFFSQYHAPLLPYWIKIAFGAAELLVLVLFLSLSGKHCENQGDPA
ncbi:MAG: stage II sporulation protein M [Candidatus Pacebacteria bacterium]|nr:stage II sporulation protein M [Candidatus Paceibacterota bacterium]